MKRIQHQQQSSERNQGLNPLVLLLALMVPAVSSCSSMKNLMAIDPAAARNMPIANPFGNYYAGASGGKENIILRTKKGDRSVEVELPGSAAEMTDFSLPLSPSFREDGRHYSAGADGGMIDERYHDRQPGITDREIAQSFPQGKPEDEGNRREVEAGLGLVQAEDPTPQSDKSYLASLDHVKQLYKATRYEAALLELDELVRQYPTDPKIYEMRGTLLDRLGKSELAVRSWTQALRFNPSNASLRRFIERRSAPNRGLASPRGVQ